MPSVFGKTSLASSLYSFFLRFKQCAVRDVVVDNNNESVKRQQVSCRSDLVVKRDRKVERADDEVGES